MKLWLKILLTIIAIPLGLAIVISIVTQFVPEKPPADFLITNNFVDLSQMISISKYRSCNGHKTLPQWANEPPSNMQHYFLTNQKFSENENTVKIFAPFDGYATDSAFNASEGITFFTKSQTPWWPFNQWRFNVPHTHLKPGLSGIVKVKAGELVGYGDSGLDQMEPGSLGIFETQVRIGILAIPPQWKDGNGEPWKKLDSVFNYMSPSVFAEYQKAIPGLKSKDDMILTREYRLTHPCTYRKKPFFETGESDFLAGNAFIGIGLNNLQKAKSEMNKIQNGCYSLDSRANAAICKQQL